MLITAGAARHDDEQAAIRSMYEARKRVFVDLLRWDVPIVAGRYERDQFDDVHATYLIIADTQRRHLGSARLLRTDRPHILDTLFRDLCARAVPRGPDIYELTRFCVSPELRARERRIVRNQLVTAIAAHAVENGINTYTGVAEVGWLAQILTFGWDARLLGEPRLYHGRMLGALDIHIEPNVLAKLAAGGVYADPQELLAPAQAA